MNNPKKRFIVDFCEKVVRVRDFWTGLQPLNPNVAKMRRFGTMKIYDKYAAMLETLDDSVERVIAKLKAIGDIFNTVMDTTGQTIPSGHDSDSDELYNIEKDIGETTNLIEQHPEAAKNLQKRLVHFLRKNMDGMPPPPDKYKTAVEQRLGLADSK